MKRQCYQIVSICLVGICVIGLCMIGVRIFAKKILIGKLGIENYVTCTLADYNWGDRIERTWKEENKLEKSQRLEALENILDGAPSVDKTVEVAVSESWADRFKAKVKEQENDIIKYCNEKLLVYKWMRQISSCFDKVLNWKLAYARGEGATYTLFTGYDYYSVEKSDNKEYVDKIKEEAWIAKKLNVPFLYVQYPYRVDEDNSQVPWGADAYENENTDFVLKALEDNGIYTLDLRKSLASVGWDNNSGFYETDGHWTTRSGFLSAGIIADYLNEQFGYRYDVTQLSEEKYQVIPFDVNSYMVDESVELFLPDFETELCVYDAYRDEEYRGTFEEACFDMSKADTEEYSSVLTAYSASRIRNSYLFEYENLMECNNDKRILICSNSFCWHLIPYLALDTKYIDYVYGITPEQLDYYLEQLQPDLIIVMDRA